MNRFYVTASVIAFSCASLVACSFLFPFDGYAGDAGDAADAAGDVATEASALGFCASQNPTPTFCADFDESTAVQWQEQDTGDGGTIAVDDARASSPPNSLVAWVPPASGYTPAYVIKSLGLSASSVTVEADVWFETVDPSTNGARVLAVECTGVVIYLDVTSSGKATVIYDGPAADGGRDYVDIQPSFTIAQLVTTSPVHMKLVVGLATSSVDFSLNGLPEVSGFIIPRTLPTSQPSVDVGLYFTESTTTGWKVRYDNIVANAQ